MNLRNIFMSNCFLFFKFFGNVFLLHFISVICFHRLSMIFLIFILLFKIIFLISYVFLWFGPTTVGFFGKWIPVPSAGASHCQKSQALVWQPGFFLKSIAKWHLLWSCSLTATLMRPRNSLSILKRSVRTKTEIEIS